MRVYAVACINLLNGKLNGKHIDLFKHSDGKLFSGSCSQQKNGRAVNMWGDGIARIKCIALSTHTSKYSHQILIEARGNIALALRFACQCHSKHAISPLDPHPLPRMLRG